MVPVPWSSSVATASTSWTPRSMPIYHIQLNKTGLRSPAAAASRVGGGVVRCAHTGGVTVANPIKITTAATVEAIRISVSYLRDHVLIVDITAGIALANVCFRVGIQFLYPRCHQSRLQQHSGIVYCDLTV